MYVEAIFAVLSCEQELACHYQSVRPVSGQFSVSQPYQNAQLAAPATLEETPEQSTQPRKRRRVIYQPNEREQEAEQRHTASEPHLLAAVAAFQRWLGSTGADTLQRALGAEQKPSNSAASQQAAEPSLQQAISREQNPSYSAATQPAAEAGLQNNIPSGQPLEADCLAMGPPAGERQPELSQGFDLLSLAELRSVVKPKFWFHSSHSQPVDLFDRVIESAAEQTGTAFETEVLVPSGSRFLVGDMASFRLLARDQPGFDCILLDPPWENKSAKRGHKYPTLPSRHLLSIPIPALCNDKAGTLVVLWLTNRERHRRFVEQELLPAWGLKAVATWFWIKVTDSGALVGPLEVAHRRPYEVMLLAVSATWRPVQPVPDLYCVFATPGQHSRKPHLGRLLRRFLPAGPRCLELFARELAQGWTSAGNEVLAFQRLLLFQRNDSCQPSVPTEALVKDSC